MTVVVVIALSALPSLQMLGLQRLWTPQVRWIPIHEVVLAIGFKKASGILFFHAFTGCDISAFCRKGKKSLWLTWDVCEEISSTFAKLSNCPAEVSSEDLKALENLLVLTYDRSGAATSVDEAGLAESSAHIIPYHWWDQPCRNMPSMLPARLGSSGVRQLSSTERPAVLLTRGWHWKESDVRSVGQHSYPLQPPVGNWRKCSCKMTCNESASVIIWDFHVLHTALCSCEYANSTQLWNGTINRAWTIMLLIVPQVQEIVLCRLRPNCLLKTIAVLISWSISFFCFVFVPICRVSYYI